MLCTIICLYNSSAGHCAQYCMYTTVDNESQDIINIITGDKRQTNRSSVAMEKEGYMRK